MATVQINGRISKSETAVITKEYAIGTKFEEIANEYQELYDNQIALVMVNGKITELFKEVKKDCELSFITLKESIGHKTYVRSATMLLMKAIHDVIPAEKLEKVKLEFAIGKGYYQG